MSKIVEKICEHCGKKFSLPLKWQKRRFCCVTCSNRYVRSKITKEQAQEIINLGINYTADVLSIKFNISKVTIRRIWSGKIWKELIRPKELKDIVLERKKTTQIQVGWRNDFYDSLPNLTERQEQIIVGSLLGDAWITNDRGGGNQCAFAKTQCKKFQEYIEWHHQELLPYSSSIGKVYSNRKIMGNKDGIIKSTTVDKRHVGYRLETHRHPYFTTLWKKWYLEGRKIIPRDITLDPLTLAVWFCDDGSNRYEERHAAIFTQGFTIDEASFLIELLKNRFNLESNITLRISPYTGNNQPVLNFYSKSYDNLIEIIKPYVIWDCFAYKIRWRVSKKFGENNVKSILTEKIVTEMIEMKNKGLTYKQIKEITGINKSTIADAVSGRTWKHVNAHRPPKHTKSKIEQIL